MPTTKNISAKTLKDILHVVEHDYQNAFVQRFEYAVRLRQKKRGMPAHAVDEIRNAFDHFAKAIMAAAELDAGVPIVPRTNKSQIPTKPTRKKEPALHVLRGKKHILAGQFHSIHYTIGFRAKDIDTILKSSLPGNRLDVKKYRKNLETMRASWKPIRRPSDSPKHTLAEIHAEIKQLDASNLLLDIRAERIDRLFEEIKDILLNKRVRT